MRRLTFNDLREYLPVKDLRAIKSWCKKHKVKIFKDGGKSWQVWEDEFLTAYSKDGEISIFANKPLRRENYQPTSSYAIKFQRDYDRAA